ncbi:hypothetical protein DFQ45_11474 [Thiopseudomonas denitrificans]|uniref:Uncharacterized protein n=1 Tax=Thiopseudomonas denitrificans TaxID=1501432 RepID=A0A4V3D4J0_9GAMM|nr:hypothetical protein DFQ45_11474 [Thiopseudomonas denitrificans]
MTKSYSLGKRANADFEDIFVYGVLIVRILRSQDVNLALTAETV